MLVKINNTVEADLTAISEYWNGVSDSSGVSVSFHWSNSLNDLKNLLVNQDGYTIEVFDIDNHKIYHKDCNVIVNITKAVFALADDVNIDDYSEFTIFFDNVNNNQP